MAENFVVKEVLTEDMVDAGEALLRELDKAGVPIDAALWVWYVDDPEWRLMFSAPLVENFYREIHLAMDKLSPKHQDILDMSVGYAIEGSELARGLKAIDPLPGIHRQRLRTTLLGSHYIKDGLLYRAT